MDWWGAPPADAPLAVVAVHGRGQSPAEILDVARRLDLPPLAFLASAAAGGSWYPKQFMAPIAENEPHLGRAEFLQWQFYGTHVAEKDDWFTFAVGRLGGSVEILANRADDQGTYFKSVYVRTPSGALFELAVTTPLGWAIDESPNELGSRFQLPPQCEDQRDDILSRLEPVAV